MKKRLNYLPPAPAPSRLMKAAQSLAHLCHRHHCHIDLCHRYHCHIDHCHHHHHFHIDHCHHHHHHQKHTQVNVIEYSWHPETDAWWWSHAQPQARTPRPRWRGRSSRRPSQSCSRSRSGQPGDKTPIGQKSTDYYGSQSSFVLNINVLGFFTSSMMAQLSMLSLAPGPCTALSITIVIIILFFFIILTIIIIILIILLNLWWWHLSKWQLIRRAWAEKLVELKRKTKLGTWKSWCGSV